MIKKTKKTQSSCIDCLLTQFRNRISRPSIEVSLEELKKGSELRGFSELPIADIRLVTELMDGMEIVPARRKNKPSRAECLDYIAKAGSEIRNADPDPLSSRDEYHDSISDPSSDDSD